MAAGPNPQMATAPMDDIPEDMDYETAKRLADRAMQRNACIQQGRAALRQAETTSHVGGYAAASAAGPGGKVASKAIGVGTARVVRGQVQAIAANPC